MDSASIRFLQDLKRHAKARRQKVPLKLPLIYGGVPGYQGISWKLHLYTATFLIGPKPFRLACKL
jgi:hypothetical protein